MGNRIFLSTPHMGGGEKKFIDQAFEQNFIAPLGPNVDGLESDIASYIRIKDVAALSSGTAAIHLALILLGVDKGDEVICQSFTFTASANPIVYLGATPVFVDSEPNTWNMCPDTLELAIKDRLSKGKRVKAVIPVHLYGMPAQMREIQKVCEHYEVPIIEDAAEALGSKYNNQFAGTLGKFGVLSFNGNKIITTSGGGALVSNDTEAIQKARILSTQARDPAPHYEHSQIGYNYRMSNIAAGIGRGQMEVLEKRVTQRRYIYDTYFNEFGGVEGISFQKQNAESFSNRWLTAFLIDPNLIPVSYETIRIELEKFNIETRPLWKPMHMQPVYKDAPFYGSGVSEDFFSKGLCLPSSSNMTTEQQQKVIYSIKNLLTIK